MNQKQFAGVGVALVTPFTEDGAIDFDGLANLLAHTYADGAGVDYWVVQGTTGESATLSQLEKVQVLDFVVRHNPHKLPIVYGIGGNNTQAILETMQSTNLTGVDAILSVNPYYNKPSQEGIYAHFKTIADAATRPLILYNVPGRTSSNMQAETTLRLAEHANILAMKEASQDMVQCMKIAKHKPKDFLLLSGEDLLTLPILSYGGEGVISVLANAYPKIFRKLVHSAREEQFKEASQYLYQLLEINPLMYEESNPVGVKQVLAFQGVCGNQVRLPLLKASANLAERIKRWMPES